jgi:LysM repeat protein
MTSKTSDFARYNRASQIGAPLISRKDTIIIAMLVNIALLVVLFATASKRHEVALAAKAPEQVLAPIVQVAPKKSVSKLPLDEIDELLASLATNKVATNKVASGTEQSSVKSTKVGAGASVKQDGEPEYYIVKSGDNPWTIARKFHIKFEDLLRLNNLDQEKAKNLKIGQKLRIK